MEEQSRASDSESDDENGLAAGGDDISLLTNQLARQTIATSGSSARHIKIQNHKILRKQYEKLYDYQKDGIDFLLRKFNETKFRGCILADDMG